MNLPGIFARLNIATTTQNPPYMGVVHKILITLLFTASSYNAVAHHSASRFDFGQSIPIAGVVKVLDVANPHIKLILEVKDDDGNIKEIEFEGHSRNNVYRRGWRPDMLSEGDTVTINFHPKRNGEDGGYIGSFTLKDGRTF